MSESHPFLSSHHRQNRYPFSYRFQFIHSKGALLVLFWSLMISFYQQFSILWVEIVTPLYLRGFADVYAATAMTFLYPLMGLIGDIWISRYRIIISCAYCSFFVLFLLSSGYIALSYDAISAALVIVYVSYAALNLICAGFQINLLTFNIDQLVGSSSDELSAVIHWHNAAFYLSSVLMFVLLQYIYQAQFVCLAVSGVCITAVLVSHSLFRHWLDTTAQTTTTNPLKLIARVLHYARKHKYPENRSALTYWEEEAPSRLNLGKEKYGGPFTEEEVEDVKTVLRLIPLFICNTVLGIAAYDFFGSVFDPQLEVVSINAVPLICTLLYQFLLYPCLYRIIPSLLKRIAFGMFLSLLANGVYTVLFLTYSFSYTECVITSNSSVTPVEYRWLPLIPQVLSGLAYYFVRVMSMEFTLAQSPKSMRGLMIGLLLLAKGLGALVEVILDQLFERYLISSTMCGFYFSSVRTFLIFLAFILFVFLAGRYKYRVRSTEINVHIIAEDHIERYMDQSEEYRHDYGLSLSIESTVASTVVNR